MTPTPIPLFLNDNLAPTQAHLIHPYTTPKTTTRLHLDFPFHSLENTISLVIDMTSNITLEFQ